MEKSEKLVVAVSSRALFDMELENSIFEKQGLAAYKRYQQDHLDLPMPPGVAFPFIQKLLSLNQHFPNDIRPFQVVVLSRNTPETGQRFFKSCQYYNLPISRGAFTSGYPTFNYIRAFNASLFLTANPQSVFQAVTKGYPAGLVLPSKMQENDREDEIRIAFDFDGVLIDDESEKQFRANGLMAFKNFEMQNVHSPHKEGPLAPLFNKLGYFQQLDFKLNGDKKDYKPLIRISIVTTRGFPCEQRIITTLKNWGMETAELYFMDGFPKDKVLEELRAHIYFDDQLHHLEKSSKAVPSVLIPFGVTKEGLLEKLSEYTSQD